MPHPSLLALTRSPLVRALAALAVFTAAPTAHALPASGGDPIVLPAPKDLAAAASSIEKATGAKAGAIELDAGAIPVSEGRSFELAPRVAERLLAGSHTVYRKAGVYLFRYERGFGMGDAKDRVGLLATADPDAVVRRIGTGGTRHGVTPEKLIAWLHALAKDEPFTLVEIAPDELVARFEKPPKDAGGVARRAVEIAPDVLAGGANTVESLADEIRQTGTLHLIWD